MARERASDMARRLGTGVFDFFRVSAIETYWYDDINEYMKKNFPYISGVEMPLAYYINFLIERDFGHLDDDQFYELITRAKKPFKMEYIKEAAEIYIPALLATLMELEREKVRGERKR